MRKVSLTIIAALLLSLSAALAADLLVNVYVGGKQVNCNPQARVRNGVTYAPLRAAAEAVGAHVQWSAATRVATICTEDRCAPIKQSQAIMVNGSMLIPVRLMSQALGREITWDANASAVRIK
ncbi:MAG: copper amine oxidase N-terminal domain-containing protein [Armatimonadia bacterium]